MERFKNVSEKPNRIQRTGARPILRLTALLLLAAAFFCLLPNMTEQQTTFAEDRISQDDIDELKGKLGGLDKALSEQEKKLAEMTQSAAKLEAAVASYSALAKQYYDQIAEVEKSKELTSAAIRDCSEQLAAVESDREKLYDNYKLTLRALRESRDASLLELVFQAKSLEEVLSAVERAKDLAEYKRKIMVKIDSGFKQIEDRKESLEKEYAEQEAYERSLEELRGTVLQKIEETEASLTAIAQKQLEAEKQIKDMEDVAEALQKELTALIKRYEEQQARDRLAKQTLLWPLDYPRNRRCTSPYGYRYHPITHNYKFHSGVDLAGPTGGAIMGDNIYAAMDGVVITAVVNRGKTGYGTYVIISHGYSQRYKCNLSTLYAHCESISVKKGDTVKQGQLIGKVGSTGASTGAHLHFEVRANGVTTDPFSYAYITKIGAEPTDPSSFIVKSY